MGHWLSAETGSEHNTDVTSPGDLGGCVKIQLLIRDGQKAKGKLVQISEFSNKHDLHNKCPKTRDQIHSREAGGTEHR